MSNDTNSDAGSLLALSSSARARIDFLRAFPALALQQAMEAEVGEFAHAGKGEIAPDERETMLNGYRRRDWEMRFRTISPISRRCARGRG